MTVIITKQSFAHRYMYGDLLLRIAIAIAWHDYEYSIPYTSGSGSLGINLLPPIDPIRGRVRYVLGRTQTRRCFTVAGL